MQHYMYTLIATSPAGLTYTATVFRQGATDPNPQEVLDAARQQYPHFTDITIASVKPISPDTYATLVRQMCDSDEWGFHAI